MTKFSQQMKKNPGDRMCQQRLMGGGLLLFATIIAIFFITSCRPTPSWQPQPKWTYSDLRLLLPANGENPDHEITAIYARNFGNEFQIRLDLLQSPEDLDYDLYIALDTAPGGGGALPFEIATELNWDILIHIYATGVIRAVDKNENPATGLNLRIYRDTTLDMVVISMDRLALGKPIGGLSFQVFLIPTGKKTPAADTGILSSDGWSGSNPLPRADAVLVFWDTFPASSPAQALRRWNGAHTGPDSERHGLQGLLRALSETQTPAILLDLKTPSSLSALDYVGGLSLVQKMEERRLLGLPDAAPIASAWSQSIGQPPEWALQRNIQESKTAGKDYGFRPSPYLYYPSEQSPPHQAMMDGHYRLVLRQAVSFESPWQASVEGPSLEVRRHFLDFALRQDNREAGPLILGGSLAESTWGNYQAALKTLQYLESRPWINFLYPEDPSITQRSATQTTQSWAIEKNETGSLLDSEEELLSNILKALYLAPDSTPSQLAWQFYRDLLSPPSPVHEKLAELRRGYIGYIGLLLAAAEWGEVPDSYSQRASCSMDLDWDGKPECILASEDVFFVIKPEGGYIALGFAKDDSGIYQILGPSYQFLVGISDPTLWQPELRWGGDPNQYRGAFSDIPAGFTGPSWETSTIETGDNWISFESPDESLIKTYRLVPGGLTVDYNASRMLQIQVPLVMDPGSRLSPEWRDRYHTNIGGNQLVWYLERGPSLELYSEQSITVQAFIDSRDDILAPENPNYEFPPGHFLLFPMILAEIYAQGVFTIDLLIFD